MNPRSLVLALTLVALTLTAPALAQQIGGGGGPSTVQNLPAGWTDGDTICDPGGQFGNWADLAAFSFGSGGPYVSCRLQPSDETPTGGRTPEAMDVTNCRGEAKARDDRYLNVSAIPSATSAEPECFVTLRFPIQETLPKNVTVVSAVLTVFADFNYYNNQPDRTAQLDRDLVIRSIFSTWDESTASFDRFPAGTGYSPIVLDRNEGFNGTSTAGGRSCQNGVCEVSSQDPSQAASVFPLPKSFRVTPSVWCAYEYRPGDDRLRTCEGHTHGWIVLDEGNGNCADTTDHCRQSFYSSAARTTDRKPLATCAAAGGPNGQQVGDMVVAPAYCWPKLDVLVDPNRPRPRNLTFHYNTSAPHRVWNFGLAANEDEAIYMPGNVPFNISIDGLDPKGAIRSGSFEIRNQTGKLFAREEFQHKLFNLSAFDPRRDPGEKSKLWTVRAFDLPEGHYYVNVTLLDVDNHRLDLNMTAGQPVLWIDRTPPRMSQLTWPTSVKQTEPVNLSVRLFDERRVDSVTVEIERPIGAPLTFKMKPGENTEGGRSSDWYFLRGWSDPGNYTMRIRANDTLGNLNVSAPLVFRVIDVKLPRACGAGVTTPDLRFGTYAQEAGGKVKVSGCALDETPLVVTTTCVSAGGTERRYEMPALEEEGRYATEFTAVEPGRHECVIRARDVDENVVDILTFPLLVEPSTAPRASSFIPLNGGFANATPVASVTYFDYNLDRASIRIDASVDGGPFERAVPVLFGTPIDTRAVFAGRTFDAGDTVTLRASANDTLGNAAEPVTWTFRIDAKPPRLNLTLTGDRAPGPVAPYVTRAAKVSYLATDDLSGVSHVEAKWTRVPPADAVDPMARDETPWREVTGDLSVVDAQVDKGAGTYLVSVRAFDAAGNGAPAEEVRFVLDPDAPVVKASAGPGELRIDAADPGSGLRSLVVGSRLVGDPTFRVTDLQTEVERAPQGGRFVVSTPVVSKGESLEYYVTAVDALGNRFAIGSPTQPARITGENHRPILVVDAPLNDTEIEGPLEVRWKATDEDGDSVRVDVEIRPVVLDEGEVLAANAPPRGLAAWDSRQSPDGLYVLEVRARDSESTSVHISRVVVNNTGTGLGRLVAPTGRVEYLETVRFEVTLYRPVVDAKVRVFELDGIERRLVATHVLRDDGTKGDRTAGDGVYTATYAANEKGEYQTDVEVVYSDAGTVVLPAATTYSVKSSFTSVLERNLLWFILGSALVVALGAFVVVQLMRYGYI